MTNAIEFTRINNDVNGNPRYVCHFTNLLGPFERSYVSRDVAGNYAIACKRANRIGGRKYHTKAYGGGIVFQSYSLDELRAAIACVIADSESGK